MPPVRTTDEEDKDFNEKMTAGVSCGSKPSFCSSETLLRVLAVYIG